MYVFVHWLENTGKAQHNPGEVTQG